MAEGHKASGRDVALVYAPTDDGRGARIVRARNGTLETGEVRPVRDGQPLNQGELVRLTPREDASPVYDVEVLHSAVESAPEAEPRGGPAQVASDDYRVNWDRIFGPPLCRSKRDPTLN